MQSVVEIVPRQDVFFFFVIFLLCNIYNLLLLLHGLNVVAISDHDDLEKWTANYTPRAPEDRNWS